MWRILTGFPGDKVGLTSLASSQLELELLATDLTTTIAGLKLALLEN